MAATSTGTTFGFGFSFSSTFFLTGAALTRLLVATGGGATTAPLALGGALCVLVAMASQYLLSYVITEDVTDFPTRGYHMKGQGYRSVTPKDRVTLIKAMLSLVLCLVFIITLTPFALAAAWRTRSLFIHIVNSQTHGCEDVDAAALLSQPRQSALAAYLARASRAGQGVPFPHYPFSPSHC